MKLIHRSCALVVLCLVVAMAACSSGGGKRKQKPGAPANLVATAGDTQVTLTWDPVAGAVAYNLYWSTTPGVTVATGAQIPSVTSPHVHTLLTNGTTYHYVVTAVHAAGEGPESAEASATPVGTPPPAPTNPAAVASNGLNTVAWTDAPGATSHHIYWSLNPGVTKANGTQIPGVTSPHDHTGLTNGTTYYYVITAENGNGESVESAEVGATPGAAATVFALHNNAAGGDLWDWGEAILVDGSGRLVLTGGSSGSVNGEDMAIWRYLPTGALDTTFGGVGYVSHDNAAGGSGNDVGMDLVIDGSGNIVVAGRSDGVAGDDDMAIWRYTDAGVLDTTFGTVGYLTHGDAAGGASWDVALDVAIDGTGRILATGYSRGASNLDMVVWACLSTGTLDPAFGTAGFLVRDNIAGGSGNDEGAGIAVDGSDRIIVAGTSRNSKGDDDIVIWRFLSDGSPDTSFQTVGHVIQDNHPTTVGNDWAAGIALDSLGRIVVGGSSRGTNALDGAAWRFTSAGALDTTFGGTGWVLHDGVAGGFTEDRGNDVTVDSLDRVIVAGDSDSPTPTVDMALWRWNPDGSLDLARAHHDAGGGDGYDYAWGVAVDPSGVIYVTGETETPNDADMVIWRVQ